jgi:putative acetyltransferase
VFIVRPARAEERAALLPIWRSAVEASHHFLAPADIDWYEPFVASFLETAADLRVAVRAHPLADGRTAGEPLGFIAHDAGAIQMLFVTAEAQGTGVGSALLASVRGDSRGPGGTGSLTVDVNEDNASGRRFYESRGFTVVSRSPLDDQGRPFPLLHLRLAADA